MPSFMTFNHCFQKLSFLSKRHNHIVNASIKEQPENLNANKVGRKHAKVNLGRTTKKTIHAVPMSPQLKKKEKKKHTASLFIHKKNSQS